LVEVLAVSMKPLHCDASIVLPCGVEAAALNPLLCASNALFSPGCACGALAAIIVRHASYYWMYSSHSGTPTESALEVSVFDAVLVFAAVFAAVFVVVVFVTTAVLVLFVLVFAAVFAVEPHPIEAIAKQKVAATLKMLVNFI
jgi:hypothetical protein